MTTSSVDLDAVLAPYRNAADPFWGRPPSLKLLCPVCLRRLGDLSMVHGRMRLLQRSMVKGIPEGRPSLGPHPAVTGGNNSGRPGRRPKHVGVVFESPEGDRWRFVCVHKTGDRALLDRPVTATTLERLYGEAIAYGLDEVVLPT